jgi:transposase
MHRHELSDPQYAHLEPFLPEPRHYGQAGRPWLPHRAVVNGILWILRTGAPWRDLPERYGKWNTVYTRFKRWRRDGTWTRVFSTLLDERNEQGHLDHDL